MIPNVISTGYRISNMSLRAYGSAGVGALIQDGSFQARILIRAKQQALGKVCQRLRLKRGLERVTISFFHLHKTNGECEHQPDLPTSVAHLEGPERSQRQRKDDYVANAAQHVRQYAVDHPFHAFLLGLRA